MLGNIALYLANRAAGGAVGSLTRWASWGAVAALLGTSAFVFALIALFWFIAPLYGGINAAALIAAGLFLLALACIATPTILDILEQQAAKRAAAQNGPIVTTVQAVSQETAAAVDYFGPLQVVASAFIVGMRTAHQFRGRIRGRNGGRA